MNYHMSIEVRMCLLKHQRNEILEEAWVEPIVMVMRRLQWFGHLRRSVETENIRAVAEIKMEGKRHKGRPRLRWKDTVRRDMKSLDDQGGMGH